MDGVSFEPNPFYVSYVYKRVLGKFTRALSKVNRGGRKRKRNDLGKVVGFATQEIREYSEPKNNEVNNDEDISEKECFNECRSSTVSVSNRQERARRTRIAEQYSRIVAMFRDLHRRGQVVPRKLQHFLHRTFGVAAGS